MIHGNYANYISGRCRCDLCSAAHRRELKRWRCFGPKHQLVDAARTQQHIRDLLAAGMPFNALAKAAGYASRNSITSVLEATRIRATTASRILAVHIGSDHRDQAYVDATGTRRRLQALAALGYSSREIALRLGTNYDAILDVQNGTSTTVRQFRALEVRDLYDRLSMTPGRNTRAAAHARKQGWVPPLAWDDDRIDNPKARVRTSVVRNAA